LNGYHIKEKDLGILVKSLAQLKFLEVLKLRDFCVDDVGFFGTFGEAVHSCSRLRSLEISNYRMSFTGCNPKGVLKMFRKIFQKTNLTHISFEENSQEAFNFDECEKLKICEIYREYPHIQSANLPKGACKDSGVSQNRWKWALGKLGFFVVYLRMTLSERFIKKYWTFGKNFE